jgi:hypothetical protein
MGEARGEDRSAGVMRLPKPGKDLVIARDGFGNRILLHGNTAEDATAGVDYDLQTDGRVCLTPEFARELASTLLKFAKAAARSEE